MGVSRGLMGTHFLRKNISTYFEGITLQRDLLGVWVFSWCEFLEAAVTSIDVFWLRAAQCFYY